ncbi:zona pellucida sperm-binding protein 3-like [Scomber scombrus]|uniref:Zona pellucida sperm-binding protein 3 n=1 Tax=Scomber scombrus TaxID=13677 RepID=A0AAV1NZM8_SCOSC
MVTGGHTVSLALLLLLALVVADAIRPLKEGPMIDSEGREYKSAMSRIDEENISGPQLTNDRSTVHVQCTEASMIVYIKADLYGKGRFVSPEEFFLGEVEHSEGSRCQATATSDTEYVIEAQLQDCGSELTMTEDVVIYSNKLIFSPAASYHGITRMADAVVPVSCHYKRTHLVSSKTQQLPLTLSTPTKPSTVNSAFSLELMTDDWTREIFSSVFYLGAVLHLEASYTDPDAAARQLFIDSCVATLTPDATSVPRYYFIENNGCLTDSKEEGSNTLFRPRIRADALQLELDVFLFHQDLRNTIFITCQMKASSEMWKSSPINKACNHVHSRYFGLWHCDSWPFDDFPQQVARRYMDNKHLNLLSVFFLLWH